MSDTKCHQAPANGPDDRCWSNQHAIFNRYTSQLHELDSTYVKFRRMWKSKQRQGHALDLQLAQRLRRRPPMYRHSRTRHVLNCVKLTRTRRERVNYENCHEYRNLTYAVIAPFMSVDRQVLERFKQYIPGRHVPVTHAHTSVKIASQCDRTT
jgi:hypothetical protein